MSRSNYSDAPPNPPRLGIRAVRFKHAVSLGLNAEIGVNLTSDGTIDGQSYTLVFDADARFLRITTRKGTVNLIPLDNVASMLVE
jgi:hypothetical protein